MNHSIILPSDDGGQGCLPIVFLHSGGGRRSHFAAQLAHFRRQRRAVAVELRGHGSTPPPGPGAAGIELLAEDLALTLDHLGLERFVLVGHSLGGTVAVLYAGAHPDRVAGLFLIDPCSDGRQVPKEAAQGMLAALRSDAYEEVIGEYYRQQLKGARPGVEAQVMADLLATPPATVIHFLEALLEVDPVTPLAAFSGPKLSLITAANEGPSGLQVLVPTLLAEKVEGTSHWIHLDEPARVTARLERFLGELSPPAR